MSDKKVRELIVEYWYRTLLSISLSIDDITKIIVEFGEEFERFEETLRSKKVKIKDNGKLISQTKDEYHCHNAFGLFNATPGSKYHWKVQIKPGLFTFKANIGIIEANKCEESLPDLIWCCIGRGYAYYSHDGNIFHDTFLGKKYGETYTDNDVIDIRLDLKDDYMVSWGKNGKDYGKGFDVKKETEYKLAVGMYYGKVKLISLDIKEY